MRKTTAVICLFICVLLSCQTESYNHLLKAGVSLELAGFRKENYKDVTYSLYFTIPEAITQPVEGEMEVSLRLSKGKPIILDFAGKEEQIHEVLLHNTAVSYEFTDEHIVVCLPQKQENEKVNIKIRFTTSDQSLNRRDEFLYTLLVPDRARTLFPCFDQPDLKATYRLSLDLPDGWSAVGNSPVESEADGTIRFKETEPLSTYLFAFVAGKLKQEIYERNGRDITIYHRETDPQKVAQCPVIADEVFDALIWLEEYTQIPYPFAKYDLIILPGFQYGGMEHTGATLYNDRRMFLNEQPTLNEQLNRSALIAHETAHMWFGDYVTMKWFDDVWTKEVFANYFAAQMVEPLYPSVNHDLNFLRNYYPAAYSEDRTAGATPIKQKLDNLSDAGLVYGQIIYNKSPIVMEKLVDRLGEEAFRKGIQEYLRSYAYGNATWEELIAILDTHTENDLTSWSRVWVHEKGMPTINALFSPGKLTVTQSDPLDRGILWPQELTYALIGNDTEEILSVSLNGQESSVSVDVSADEGQIVIPGRDGKGYGFFQLDEMQARHIMEQLLYSKDDVFKGSLLIILYENVLRKTIDAEWYTHGLLNYISKENNPLLYSMALANLGSCLHTFGIDPTQAESVLWQIICTHKENTFRLQAFRSYLSLAKSEEAIERLYTIWKEKQEPAGCILSENDYINLSYKLAIYKPEYASEIVAMQEKRINNPDRKQQYIFIAPAVSPNKAVRDSVFLSLLDYRNRSVEPWAATALAYLNHSSRQQEAVAYIHPGLEVLQEIQQTGDIFFPTNWLRSLLAGHTSVEARKSVDDFSRDYPDYPPLLKNKILQQVDHLYR
ncbi:aminopeptidase [Parabacteroides sp. OttesenSCG-928-G06]|nr:aminopeptidase [Parabacteroides sp. OttesenSCG-928-G06]